MDAATQRATGRRRHGNPAKPKQGKVPETRFETRGKKFSPPQNPPDVSLKPFNQITMVHSGEGKTSSYDYAGKDLISELIDQINPLGKTTGPQIDTSHIEMRVLIVKAWNLTGTKMAFTAYDFTHSGDNTLCSIVDIGAKDSYPTVGYEFPSVHKELIITTKSPKIFSLFTPPGDTVVIYTTLLWRLVGNPTFKFSNDLLIHISNQISSIESKVAETNQTAGSIAANTSSSAKSLNELVKAQPGLVERIVNGVAHVGAYVAPLAADEDTLQRLDELKESVNLLLTLSDAPEIL